MVTAGGVVAIVPARGGSKSIPRKNLRLLDRLPLLAYSIEAGLTAHTVDRVIVSTDDDEIARTAIRYGAEVPFMRPAELAQDETLDLPVFEHVLRQLAAAGRLPEIVVQLRPTSPLRPPGCVDDAVKRLREDAAADSVRAVTPSSQNPFKMWQLQADGALHPLLQTTIQEPFNQPRQALPETFWQTGHVDAIRTSTILGKGSMSGERISALRIDGAYAVDIDTEADWRRAEWIVRHFNRPLVRPPVSEPQFPNDLQLVVFDFDGVMTDNRVWVTGSGQEWVACSRADGLGIDRLRRLGVEVMVLSTEKDPVVVARCRKLGVACEHGVADKGIRLRELLMDRSIDRASVVYVGNDLNDLECVRLAGCGVAVADAHPEVIAEADVVLTRRGGHGAVRELCDTLSTHLTMRVPAITR